MLGFGKKRSTPQSESTDTDRSWLSRVRQGLGRTRGGLTAGLTAAFTGKQQLDDDLLEELETLLLTADVGIEATSAILTELTEQLGRRDRQDSNALLSALRDSLIAQLQSVEAPLHIDRSKAPYVILVVGVNGVGKTTTIGKLSKRLEAEGHSVLLAAGDTFRAAAVEQLQVWGERNNIPVIAQHTGADSASVIFDAVQAAQARDIDVVIADTAGRLHNKDNLMQELAKVVRVMKKLDDSAPHEVLLVLDAGTGQNAISQAQSFTEAVNLTGLALTKLDGTARGGVIFALARKLGIPVRFIGVGEQVDDLQPFDAATFVDALLSQDDA